MRLNPTKYLNHFKDIAISRNNLKYDIILHYFHLNMSFMSLHIDKWFDE